MARTEEENVQDGKDDAKQRELERQIQAIRGRLFLMTTLLFSVDEHQKLVGMPGRISQYASNKWKEGDLLWLQDLDRRVVARLEALQVSPEMENFLTHFHGMFS